MRASLRPALLLVLGLTAAPTIAQGPKEQALKPDPRSFGTPAAQWLLVALTGKDWALVMEFPEKDFPYHKGALPLSRTVMPARCVLHLGPDVGAAFKPPCGVPQPNPFDAVAKNKVISVDDLSVTLVAKERLREPDAYVLISVSRFAAGGKVYAKVPEMRLPLRGPYP